MKKFLISIGLAAVVILPASAQNFVRQQMMQNVNLYLTNQATAYTNVLDNAGNTNLATVIITNRVTGSAYTTTSTVPVQTVQAFKDVPFILPGPGAWSYITSGAATNSTLEVGIGYAGANATNGFNIEIVPLLSGYEAGQATTEPFIEDTANKFILFKTNNTAVTGITRFGINSAAYVGYWGLRLKTIYPNVNPVAADSQFVVTNVSLNGWRP